MFGLEIFWEEKIQTPFSWRKCLMLRRLLFHDGGAIGKATKEVKEVNEEAFWVSIKLIRINLIGNWLAFLLAG